MTTLDLLTALDRTEDPPNAHDDLVHGARVVSALMRDRWAPVDVKAKCREWLASANAILASRQL